MAKVDAKVFNTDPKHEAERNDFDALIEGSVERITKKKEEEKKKNPPAPEGGFLESFLNGILGK